MIINQIRNQIAEDATEEEYQALMDSVDGYPPIKGGFIARGQEIVVAWEKREEGKRLAEKDIPKLSAVESGRMAHLHYRENVDTMMEGR